MATRSNPSDASRRTIAWRNVAVKAAAILAAAVVLLFYFAQYARLTPNTTDGGLILTYVDDMAHGMWPHRDFVDAYGPLNWPGVVLSYKLAGNREWGVRIWLLLVKLVIVGLTFLLTRRLTSTFYGLVAALLMALLFGQAWQSLQTPYGFIHVVPLLLGAWYFLLCGPFRSALANVATSGLLTAAAICTKINSGFFLLAGGLFVCLYWLPPSSGCEPRLHPAVGALVRSFQKLGLVVLPLVFYVYVRRFFDVWYFTYLIAPILAAVGSTWLYRRDAITTGDHPVFRSKACVAYLGTTIFGSAAMLLVFPGPAGTLSYIEHLSNIVRHLHYEMPFARLGVPGPYVGLNENYWLQLPWLMSLAFLAWASLQAFGRGRATFGTDLERKRGIGVGVFMLATVNQFVMYSRSDETHVFESLVVVPPALMVLLAQIEPLLLRGADSVSRLFRNAVAISSVLWGSTIFVRPGLAAFDLRTGDHLHPVLKYLHYRDRDSEYVWDFSPNLPDHEWDRVVDEAAAYIDEVTPDGSSILVLDPTRTFHVLSSTRPVGGRYHFYFYMLSAGLFRRDGFDAAVPPHVLEGILDDPPPVVVGVIGRVPPVALAFPELRAMVAEKYVVTAQFRHYLIYQLKPEYRQQAANRAAPSPGPK